MLLYRVGYEPFCMLSSAPSRNYRSLAFGRRISPDLMARGGRGTNARPDRTSLPPEPDSGNTDNLSGSDHNFCSNPVGLRDRFNESVQSPLLNPNCDDNVFDCYTDEQLKQILLKKLDRLYNEAITKLVALGHDKSTVLEAILRNGHVHGDMDLLTNILHNTQLYLSNGASDCEGNKPVNTNKAFPNLMQLKEASLISIICLLRRNNPCLSIWDAMCFLLWSDFDIITDAPRPNDDGDDVTTQSDDVEPIWSDPSPSMLALLKDNAAFLGSEYRRLERAIDQSVLDPVSAIGSNVSLEVHRVKNQVLTRSILKRFSNMNLEDTECVPEGDKLLLSLMKEIEDLEIQVKEKKKWADERTVQAARRLCEGRIELKKLRMERAYYERMQQDPESTLGVDHPNMKSLIEVETTLKQASEQVDRAVMVVTTLEVENMEIRAEIEASRLHRSESLAKIIESEKKEKTHLKKILACEKNRAKLHEDLAIEKQKLMEFNEEMLQFQAARKTAEAKCMEEKESKKHALARIKEERRLKEERESVNRRNREYVRDKMDVEFKSHKDDMKRLEEELSRVKSWADPDQYLNSFFGAHFEDETIGKLLHGSGNEDDDEDDVVDHECVICEENEACVVFLPCAHEVVCADCSEWVKMDECPICGVAIEDRIRVFGGSS